MIVFETDSKLLYHIYQIFYNFLNSQVNLSPFKETPSDISFKDILNDFKKYYINWLENIISLLKQKDLTDIILYKTSLIEIREPEKLVDFAFRHFPYLDDKLFHIFEKILKKEKEK